MKTTAAIISTTTPLTKTSGVAGIKISAGSNNTLIKKIITSITQKPVLFPKLATYSKIYINNQPIDDGILIFFTKQHSYTGEDTLEIFTHGNKKIVKSLINSCIKKFKNDGLRHAKRGEFIERAYKNGKIDNFELQRLIKILIKNHNPINSFKVSTNIKSKLTNIINQLFNIRLYLENAINFNTNTNINNYIKLQLNIWLSKLQTLKYKHSYLFKSWPTIVIVGHENVGKSSIFNMLTHQQKSISSHTKGTTRNLISAKLKFNNIKCKLIDTPGYPSNQTSLSLKLKNLIYKTIKTADIIINVLAPNEKPKIYKKPIINVINKIDKITKKTTTHTHLILNCCKLPFGSTHLYNSVSNKIRKLLRLKYLPSIKAHKQLLKQQIKTLNKNIKYYTPEVLNTAIKQITKTLINTFNINFKKTITQEIFRKFCIGK